MLSMRHSDQLDHRPGQFSSVHSPASFSALQWSPWIVVLVLFLSLFQQAAHSVHVVTLHPTEGQKKEFILNDILVEVCINLPNMQKELEKFLTENEKHFTGEKLAHGDALVFNL